jgi:hypothetical protein
VSGNPSPNQSGLQNRDGQPRGKARRGARVFLEYAYDTGVITSMTETPILDYVKSVALDPAMRADLRLGAAAIAAKYESHSKGPKPYIPKLPAGFKLPRLVSVAACQESLAIITESVLTGVLTPDAGDYLRKHVEAVLPSLQESEVRQEITALKEFIEQVEQKTITLVPDETPKNTG